MEWRISKRCTKETFRNAHWDGKRARLGEIKILTYMEAGQVVFILWVRYVGISRFQGQMATV